MPGAGSPLGRWRGPVFAAIAGLVVAADQLTKAWIRTYPEGNVIFEVGFLRIVHVRNTGAAFGLFQGQSPVLAAVVILGILLILAVFFLARRHFPFLAGPAGTAGLGLVLGGAVGNLTDRFRFGSVTDFVDIGSWPAFNVADSSVDIGVVIVAILLLRLGLRERRSAAG